VRARSRARRLADLESLGSELFLIRSKVLAEKNGFRPEDPQAYGEAVRRYFGSHAKRTTTTRSCAQGELRMQKPNLEMSDTDLGAWVDSDVEWHNRLVEAIGPFEASKIIYIEIVFGEKLFRWIN